MNLSETTYITANIAGTLDGLMRERIRISPQKVAYQYFDKSSKEWIELDWSAMGQQISRYQQALEKENLQEGDRVAILLKNCPQWVAFEQAALGLGLAETVPGRSALIDGFGLIAFASLCPIISVMAYALNVPKNFTRAYTQSGNPTKAPISEGSAHYSGFGGAFTFSAFMTSFISKALSKLLICS